MNYTQAESLLDEILAPLSSREFYRTLGRSSWDVKGSAGHPRRGLLGDDPKRTLLAAYATHGEQLDCHATAPSDEPPPLRRLGSPDEMAELIGTFHERGYTVRIPDVVALTPELRRFARAIELLLHQPVGAEVFWSKAGAKAMVHYDRRDNLIIQLEGRKRWFISDEPPGLQNNWKQVGEAKPNVDKHRVVDVEPGDLIYIPRGTPHTVDSTTESLHLGVLFIPTTLRETMIAALDYVSEFERSLRETAVARPGLDDLGGLPAQVSAGLSRLLELSSSREFIDKAMSHHSARVIRDLAPLEKPAEPPAVRMTTRVRHSPLAIAHLRKVGGIIDFVVPGDNVAVHAGVEPELSFIAGTSEFRIADLPGDSTPDVKIALIARLILSGFLEVAEG